MENSQGTSFIPKSPVRATTKPRSVRRVFIFTYITFVFFFGTLIATVVIFVWNITIDQQLETQKNNLSLERESFNNAQLEEVRELESRMKIASAMIDRHVSVYSIFESLEESTLRSVKITGFEYIKDLNNSLNLSLQISAHDFNSALFQTEIFSVNSILAGADVSKIVFANPIQSEDTFSLTEEVIYLVTKELTPSDIPYVPKTFTQSFIETIDTLSTDESLDDLLVEDDTLEEENIAPVMEITDTINQ